jgi:cyanophycin synthetase
MPLKIEATVVYAGPSVHSRHPAIRYALVARGASAAEFGLRDLERLCKLLPDLRTHACFANEAGATHDVAHVFEHLCIELQNLAGGRLACVRAGALLPQEPGAATVPCEDAEVCAAAATLARDLLDGVPGGDAELARRIDGFIAFGRETLLPVQDRALVQVARARDIPVTQLVGRFLALGQGRFQQRVSASSSTLTNSIASHLAANKTYTHRVLEAAGLPMARYVRVYNARAAVAAARRIGYPVVVKPNSESMGAAVSVGMKNRREVVAAYRRARKLTKSVIIEELVPGNDYRLLVIGGRLRAAARRVPGHVVGDGRSSVEELVAEVNRDPRRGDGHATSLTRIRLDDQADRLLAALGYTRSSVPRAGEVVYLRRNANLSDGGTSVDVTDQVHPDNRDVAERAARAIGLDIAGVDLLIGDISTSLWRNGGRICEVNSRPGLRSHLWPSQGEPRDVLTPLIDMLFPPGGQTRIPVLAVTGTGDTAATARLLAHLLGSAGHRVGLYARRRVWSGGRRVSREKVTGPVAARMILLDPDVDVAVLELRPRDVLRNGLGCDAITVTTVVSAPPSADGEARGTIEAIRVVAASTRDVVYVADGDPCIQAIENDGGAAALCRIVTAGDPQRGAPAPRRVVQDGKLITIYDGGRERGRLAMAVSLQSLSTAVAATPAASGVHAVVAAHGVGLDGQAIDRGLRSYQPARRRGEATRGRSHRRRSPQR